MKVLGIDPGLADTGWAVLTRGAGESIQVVSAGMISTAKGEPHPSRLEKLHGDIAGLIAKHAPDAVAIEETFFLKRSASMHSAAQARGVILLAAQQAKVPIHEYNPKQVKTNLTGNGAAGKLQMQRMVQVSLKLKELPKPDDMADAIAIGLFHLRTYRLQRQSLAGGEGRLERQRREARRER